MVATIAEYPIDSPAQGMARRPSPIAPVTVPVLVEEARLPGALVASGEGG